jgi:hypothetical protein
MVDAPAHERAGLCATCRFVEIVPSSKGAVFYLCTLAATDPRFRRYPALPVRVCTGYQAVRRDP